MPSEALAKDGLFFYKNTMKKLPKKYAPLLGIFLMSVFMTTLMTFFVTAINFGGFPEDFLYKWWNAASRMIFIAFPVILVVKPSVEKIVQKITH